MHKFWGTGIRAIHSICPQPWFLSLINILPSHEKSNEILSDSRVQDGAVPLQRHLSVAGIAGLLPSRSKLPARTPVGLSSTLRRPLHRSLRQTPPCQSCTSSHVLTAGCLRLLFTAFQAVWTSALSPTRLGNVDFCLSTN